MSDDTLTTNDGVQLDLISANRVERLGQAEKIELIIRGVQDGKIVILQKGLTPDEKSELIERTMGVVEPDGFSGIEIETFNASADSSDNSGGGGLMGRASRLIGGDDGDKDLDKQLTVVGPAKRLETLKNDDDLMSALIKR